jgi:hypothetical protein
MKMYSAGGPMFPDTPSGAHLPIPCTYPFSPGPNGPPTPASRPRFDTDIPEGYSTEWIPPRDPRVTEAGFTAAEVWVGDGRVTYEERPGAKLAAYLFLLDPENALVATWDEGRWWTPDESDQFKLMLQVPATIDVQKLGPHGEYGGRR